MVANGVTGLLVPPGDVAALAVTMQRPVDDELLREELGAPSGADAADDGAVTVAGWFGGLHEDVARRALG